LGAHCEGPFINPEKNGIHKKEVLQQISSGISELEACYKAENLRLPVVKMVTMAPELDKTASVIQELASRGIIASIGHSNATYEQMCSAVQQGATMVTHLFNAISTPHHRSPGIFGVLGAQDGLVRPCYGIIADDIHVHPSFIKVAYDAHPEGVILVSDAMSMLGLPDGKYHWTNGDYILKNGGKLTLEDTATIAGRCVTPIATRELWFGAYASAAASRSWSV
jgi:N-acetylglucosamine-6-phosphate deacetylase